MLGHGGDRRALVRELAPLWWVWRAYVVVVLVAVPVAGADWWDDRPELPLVGSGTGTVVALVLAVLASIALGLRGRGLAPGRGRTAALAVNGVIALFAIPVTAYALDPERPQREASPPVAARPPRALSIKAKPIVNIYPYTRDGRLLLDVLLYDGEGNPIDVRPNTADPLRRVLHTDDGRPLWNSFPIRYYDPATMRVPDPEAGAPKRPPRIVTPPLRRRP